MSLVDYQSSSGSDSEDEKSEEKPINEIEKKSFNTLSKESTKRKEPVKIAIPSIVQDEEEEDKIINKKLKTNSSSGLLSMLPAPKFSAGRNKTNSPLIPYVLTKKKESNDSETSSEKSAVSCNTSRLQPLKLRHFQSVQQVSPKQEETKPTSSSDFFALQDSDEEEEIPLPSKKVLGSMNLPPPVTTFTADCSSIPLPSYHPKSEVKSANQCTNASGSYGSNHFIDATYPQTSSGNSDIDQMSVDSSSESVQEDILTDERFLRLQGKKRDMKDIDIIDINIDSSLPNKTEWHTKSLTEEKVVSHSRKRHNMPTQQQRRKHQITYLAFQAKEREVDLKNQWAHNRLTKRETQAKYGF